MGSKAYHIIYSAIIATCLAFVPASAKNDAETLSQLTSQGFELLREGRPDEAARLYRQILNQYHDIDAGLTSKRSLMKVYNNLGYLYLFEYNSPERAYPLLLKARDMAKEYRQNDLLAASYDNIGKLYDDFGDTKKALANFKASLEASADAESDVANSIRLMAFNDLANFAIHRELIDSIEDSLELYEKFPPTDIPMSSYSGELAKTLRLVNEGRYSEAYATLEAAGPLINAKVDTTRYRINHLIALSELAKYAGESKKGMDILQNALVIISDSNVPLSDLKVRIYNAIAQILREEGDKDTADAYRLLAFEVTDSLYNAKQFGNVRDVEIDELNRNMELSELKLNHQRRQTWVLSISIVVILILFAGLAWYTRKLNRTHRDLVRRHREAMQHREAELQPQPEKTRKLPGNPEENLRKVDEIKNIFSSSPVIYDSSFSLNQLADMIGSKPKYVSVLINDFLGTTFNQLLAEARVAESCRLLLDTEIGKKLTIEAVGERVGYRSRTHFISIFNKITGLTPSQYLKASKKNV